MFEVRKETLLSFTENIKSTSFVACPGSLEDCEEALSYAKEKKMTICSRGGGYSYGDMILNSNEMVLRFSEMNKILSWDPDSGLIIVEPGVKFSNIFEKSLPDNWTLSACPGGDITVGGAVSNNVHGKDSWRTGNFGSLVKSFKFLLSNGNLLVIDREKNKDLFRAVIGGMGLFGIMVQITLQLKKIISPFVEVSTYLSRNLHETEELLEDLKETSDFLVSWVDCFPKGKSIGRGYVTKAKWIETSDKTEADLVVQSCKVPNRIFGIFPSEPMWYLLRPFFLPNSIRQVNRLHFSLAKMMSGKKKRMLFTDWNFMHHKIPGIQHVYRPHGFLEFQPMFPRSAGVQSLIDVLELSHKFQSESLLCGVKLHGVDDFLMSYSGDAFSLGIDIQLKNRSMNKVKEFHEELMKLTISLGGKFYLAKDELLSKKFFEIMYPQHSIFKEIKEKYDEENLFSSDMYRRLFE